MLWIFETHFKKQLFTFFLLVTVFSTSESTQAVLIYHCNQNPTIPSKNGSENHQTNMLKKKSLSTRDALCAAASKGCLAAVRFLVEEGVSKTDVDKQGRTPLILATQNNHLAVVQVLEQQQPTVIDKDDMLLFKKGSNTRDALRVAALRDAVEAVRFLVEEGVSKDDGDKDGWTPLLYATVNGNIAVVQYLLEHGADKEKARGIGCTALYIAAEYGHIGLVQCLLEHGADKDKANNIDHSSSQPRTATWLWSSICWRVGRTSKRLRTMALVHSMLQPEMAA